ncbi:Sas10/Utp3/C1D family-domain-containing protein [Histomonas meleagridis]|uniref:Sas10/Utp3/C1D family-domain-containing protein n=1 Tax=Histomonas meleagridis TaxID=135588 RepID=UPI00355AC872|nr:Sas10/Utp3/C1D family-domain-containing protein [Histomonas meleagridis]KAH0805702.1 Sas10/Utp3/C1D family-domain-containing protein [Histomonas meleagridis]
MEKERKDQLENYQIVLEEVEAHLSKLTSRPLEETFNGLSEFEQAKLKTLLAYANMTISLCYLKSKGENIEAHKNMRYLEHLKKFFTDLDGYIDLSVASSSPMPESN